VHWARDLFERTGSTGSGGGGAGGLGGRGLGFCVIAVLHEPEAFWPVTAIIPCS